MKTMTEYHNVDITIAAKNGTTKNQIADQIMLAIDASKHAEYRELEECVMISKISEVEK